jgi:hypothetical protein
MAIESVTSTTYAPPQPKLKTDQAAQAAQTGQGRPADNARDTRGMSQANQATEPRAPQPQPVVNTQGQVTGKVINAIA